MESSSIPFNLIGLKLFHSKESFKIGTDALLLAGLIRDESFHTLLDLGCGSGIIGLTAASLHPHSHVTLLDVHPQAIQTVNKNISINALNNVASVCMDAFDFQIDHQKKFDAIVTNPPYHIDSLRSSDQRKSNAKHFTKQQWANWLHAATQMLKDDGKLYFICPAMHKETGMDLNFHVNLQTLKLIEVSSFIGQPANRWLIIAQKKEFTGKKYVKTKLTILKSNARNDWTVEYRQFLHRIQFN